MWLSEALAVQDSVPDVVGLNGVREVAPDVAVQHVVSFMVVLQLGLVGLALM